MSDSSIMRSLKYGTVSGAIAEAEKVHRHPFSMSSSLLALICRAERSYGSHRRIIGNSVFLRKRMASHT